MKSDHPTTCAQATGLSSQGLAISEHLLRAMIDATSELMLVKDTECVYRAVNAAFLRSVGLSYEAIIGKSDFDLFPEHEAAQYRRDDRHVLDAGATISRDLCATSVYGARWFHVTSAPLRLRNESVDGIVVTMCDVTERRRAEELAGRYAERHATLLSTAHDGIFTLDINGKLLEVNDAYCRRSGYTQAELLNLCVTDLEAVEAPEETARHIQAVRQSGFGRFESRHRRKDGALMDVEISTSYHDGTGQLVAFIRDITPRKCAEEAFRRSETRFEATFEQAAVGIAHVGPDGSWLRVNRKLSEIVGYSQEELLSLTFQDITHPDDLDADLAQRDRLLAREIDTYTTDKRYIRKDGSIVWAQLTVALTLKEDGEPDYFISVIKDISSRKQTEVELMKSEANLREAHRLAGIGNWRWDLRTNVHRWCAHIYRVFGRDTALPPAAYPDVQEYFTPESWARLSHAVETALAEGSPYECDAEVVRPDGARRWITARGQVARDAGGTPIALHGTVQDITRRKLAEDEVRQLNVGLEQRVAERTAELRAANTELDAFTYAVSHDLRSPLRAMSGFAEALADDYGDRLEGEAKVYLERIELAARRMSNLIEGLLTRSRSARRELQYGTVDVSALAQRLLAELVQGESVRKVDVEVQSGIQANGDPRMIDVAMRNLLGNAWKYTSHTAVARIRVYAEERDNTRWVCIADNGVGFDMVDVDKLFRPFERLQTREEFPGSGIGLATVQRIVERHGGVIDVHGEPDKGAVFCISLPDIRLDTPKNERE